MPIFDRSPPSGGNKQAPDTEAILEYLRYMCERLEHAFRGIQKGRDDKQ